MNYLQNLLFTIFFCIVPWINTDPSPLDVVNINLNLGGDKENEVETSEAVSKDETGTEGKPLDYARRKIRDDENGSEKETSDYIKRENIGPKRRISDYTGWAWKMRECPTNGPITGKPCKCGVVNDCAAGNWCKKAYGNSKHCAGM